MAKTPQLFWTAFVVTYELAEGDALPLTEGKKITLTIKKATDEEIKDFYNKNQGKAISSDDLTKTKRFQGYVSGTEFSGEITIKKPTPKFNISLADVTEIANPFEFTVAKIDQVTEQELDDLNNNTTIMAAVLAAIKALKDAPQDVALNVDYFIKNDGQPGDYTNRWLYKSTKSYIYSRWCYRW
ncbi:hypothetical protein [Spiroplasma sp. SV19]|uniref:hypothetical protein n=1 Tax=Spiroplasma sp. SV19 TaxID=2570468 RepID=UPI0024B6829A|nr:hypothetical protein [Spiroplasma sp. SV19]WHQ36368.1 hypothetical protein E7Y35_00185 [Spiroplasma sp. SV19]